MIAERLNEWAERLYGRTVRLVRKTLMDYTTFWETHMKAFWRVKRVDGVLWAEMHTDNPYPWYAARRPIENRSEGRVAFAEFVEQLKDELGEGK